MTRAVDHPIPDAALDSDIAILGRKGKGKTYAAKGVVERLLSLGRRVLVLDPLAVWWGLRSDASGSGPGFPIAVLGGPHGDVALADTMGPAIARLVAGAGVSVVVDMSEMRKAAWQRLVRDLLDELFTVSREPLWIVLEEADVFAPQQPREGDSVAVLGEVDRIARRGRAYGFRLISITQRPARLHKDVLTQLSTLVALGLTGPQDRDAIKAWVEGNADRDQARAVMDSLASLPVGEGWVWAPDHGILERVRFPAIRTLDTSATPKAGETRAVARELAPVDLDAVRAALAESPEADRTEKAPRTRAEHARVAPSAEALREARAEGYEAGLAEGRIQGAAEERARIVALVTAELADANRATEAAVAEPRAESSPAPRPASRPRRGIMPTSTGDAPASPAELPSAARKVLAVLDTDPPLAMSWARVATLARMKGRGGSWNMGRKALRERGLVIEEGGSVRIAHPSAKGGPPPDLAAYRAALGGRPAEILGILARSGHATRDAIAAEIGMVPRGGAWNGAWKVLRDNGLIVEADGVVRLAPELGG